MERIIATYFIETPADPEKAARALAGEQSSGTFIEVPGESEELKQQYAARVEEVLLLETVNTPSIPYKGQHTSYHRAQIRISWSMHNFGTNLPQLVSTLQGNLYEINQLTGLRLIDIDFPEQFVNAFRGPAFGIEGCRQLTGVYDRPLIGTIIKPSVGLTPAQTASMVAELVQSDLDFVKDDELLASSHNSSFYDRLNRVMEVIHDHLAKTGKKIMYAINISAELDEMLKRYEAVVEAGGTCALINMNSVGLVATKKIADIGKLAIHAHRNGFGMMNRLPMFGIAYKAYQKIWRLTGMDQMHVNGIDNKFWEPDDMVVASIFSLQEKMGHQVCPIPVVSSGQWGGQAFDTWRRTQTTDLLYMAGGGIMAHPMGAQAGVLALRQAWDAAVNGLTLEDARKSFPEFHASCLKFLDK